MFCNNPNCTHTTFAERFDFISNKGKKTNRLEDEIIRLSLNCSSITASNILNKGIANVGKSTICNILKKGTPIINKENIQISTKTTIHLIIEKNIREKGYAGSSSTLRHYIAERTIGKFDEWIDKASKLEIRKINSFKSR